MGGDCLYTGCVPSKALIKSARLLAQAKRAREFGFKAMQVEFDFADVMERVQRVVRTVEPHDSARALQTRLGVECLQARQRITSPWTVEVKTAAACARSLRGPSSIARGHGRSSRPSRGSPKPAADFGYGLELEGIAAAAGRAWGRADRLRARAVLREVRIARDAGRNASAHPDPGRPGDSPRWSRGSFARSASTSAPSTRRYASFGERREAAHVASTTERRSASLSTSCCARSGASPIPRGTAWKSSASNRAAARTVSTNEYCRPFIPSSNACATVAGPIIYAYRFAPAGTGGERSLSRGEEIRADYSVIPGDLH